MKKIKDGIKIKKKIILFSSIALFLILSLSIVSKFVLEDFIDYQSNFSKVINISGRQRMLSQRIMLLIQTLNHSSDQQFDWTQMYRTLQKQASRVPKKSTLNAVDLTTPESGMLLVKVFVSRDQALWKPQIQSWQIATC